MSLWVVRLLLCVCVFVVNDLILKKCVMVGDMCLVGMSVRIGDGLLCYCVSSVLMVGFL